jgi:hypothetical protein
MGEFIMQTKLLALFGASLAVLSAASASAQVAYTNGPTNGTITAWTINSGFAVSNSFALSATTTITGFTFGAWTGQTDAVVSVDWGISNSPDYAINGTASSLSAGGVMPGTGFGAYDVRDYTASITPLTLAAGTYWLSLQNALSIYNNAVYWDINNGPSTAYQSGYGNLAGLYGPTGSTAFTLLSSPAPEPASWAMMVGGFGLVGGAMRCRRKAAVTFA